MSFVPVSSESSSLVYDSCYTIFAVPLEQELGEVSTTFAPADLLIEAEWEHDRPLGLEVCI